MNTALVCDIAPKENNPRNSDVLEVMRRWGDARRSGWLTEEHKQMLKNVDQEHTLLINEQGEYELVPYELIDCGAEGVRAFYFERNGKAYVTFWHTTGKVDIELKLPSDALLESDLGKDPVSLAAGKATVTAENKRYLSANISKEEMCKLFAEAICL